MVEAESNEIPESKMIEAISFARKQMSPLIELIESMTSDIAVSKWDYYNKDVNLNLYEKITI